MLTENLEDGKNYRSISSPDKTERHKCQGLILEDATCFRLVQKAVFSLSIPQQFSCGEAKE